LEGAGDLLPARAAQGRARGDALVKLCRGAKACERISRIVHSLREGRRRGYLRAGPVRALRRYGNRKNGKEGSR
jgi:hypothetical protein